MGCMTIKYTPFLCFLHFFYPICAFFLSFLCAFTKK